MTKLAQGKFNGDKLMITLNQEEIQLACKRFVKEQYGLEVLEDENPTYGVTMKVMTNDWPPNTARIEADVEVKK